MKQREIKFRAWDKKDNRWVVGNDNITIRVGSAYRTDDGWSDGLVLMQYTGLKDKNGTEIYEGDVITDNFNHYTPNSVVSLSFGWIYDFIEYGLVHAELEVIGNIYENPELLDN